jgi:hypothetical protein
MTVERTGDTKRKERLHYVILTLLSLIVIGVARYLNPEGSGQGTHEQLGLPPCMFHLLTGHGCPGCGLTTSFAHLARGHMASAFHSNPVGVLLFSTIVLFIPYFLFRIVRPTPLDDLLTSPWLSRALVALMIMMFASWVIRLALGVI